MTRSPKLNVELLQDALDSGASIAVVARAFNVHHQVIRREIHRGHVELYVAYDEDVEMDIPKLTDWDIEDLLDDWWRTAFNGEEVYVPPPNRNSTVTTKLYQYLGENYDGVVGWIRKRGITRLRAQFLKVCTGCGQFLSLTQFTQKSHCLLGVSSRCRECTSDQRNDDVVRAAANRRRTLLLSLPTNWERTHRLAMRLDGGGTCDLTDETECDDDHFIPIATGHCGTYLGNMRPLASWLNANKSAANPFEWFEANRQRFELDQVRFDALVSKLAAQNGLTPEEFRKFTYWCFDNPRTVEQIAADNARYGYKKSSLEIWREQTGLPFPFAIDFGNTTLNNEISRKEDAA
ncbi:helix-turn-helix domain-containing protein [Paenibacillus sp. ACRRY]|uniref:helix-turn-helix domain-containing protein n=1 Tax=Paenibacillus sp. ACRRY TaxID=2918208 RepID=UPI001EF4413C|nr:helix-turn-helix domain-containing protein [Paenibacillus sp. ACRRY]MCG7383332.1 helix-turn-helix domain-containing protein [Paenibacillus sp. ACRRY]